MRRITFALLTASLSLGLTAVASAADLPVKARVAPVSAAPNWTGFYLGLAGGYGWGSTRQTADIASGINSGTDNNLNGGIFGLTYGYNWQTGPWVIGVEGDISWSGIKDTFNDNNGSFYCTTPFNCVTNLKWLGTDRARLGYAWDRYLVYVTGGFAYGGVDATHTNDATETDETKTRVGWTLGGGIEAMLMPHWSAKLEYLYVDLGDQTNFHVIPSFGGAAQSVLVKTSIVRLGINYRFGGLF